MFCVFVGLRIAIYIVFNQTIQFKVLKNKFPLGVEREDSPESEKQFNLPTIKI